MLTSTKPRSPPRTTRTPHPPPISYPISSLPPYNSNTALPSPSTTPPRGRRPSISNTMHWLSRSSTQSSSTPYAPSKPTRISEPKLVRSVELIGQPRSGTLGSGATVVRTPDDALRETGVRLTFDGKGRGEQVLNRDEVESNASNSSDGPMSDARSSPDEFLSSQSPPLPPLPMPGEDELELLEAEVEAPKAPPRPTRAPPPAPPVQAPTLRPSLKSKFVSTAEESYQVPPLPANIPASPVPPPFRPILVSEVPTGAVDPSKIIVTLETCTATHRTTLDTLRSRPSHLSNYVSSLFPSSHRESITSSIYSTASDDMSSYRHHLTSQGLLPQASFSIHIFLDRPSAPYAHILNYLRSTSGSPDVPETLPRAVQLQSSSSHSRLECLLELRDEAAYLGLDNLQKLCIDELRLRHAPRLHTRGHSASTVGSVHSLHASVYSLHTLLERVESDMRSNPRHSQTSDLKKDSPIEVCSTKSPPTPQSWNGPLRGRSQGRHSPSQSPPAGWI